MFTSITFTWYLKLHKIFNKGYNLYEYYSVKSKEAIDIGAIWMEAFSRDRDDKLNTITEACPTTTDLIYVPLKYLSNSPRNSPIAHHIHDDIHFFSIKNQDEPIN